MRILFCVLFSLITIGVSADYIVKSEIEAANFLAEKGIIVDKSSDIDEYRLNETIRRDEVLKVVAKLSEEEIPVKCDGIFLDVDVNGWGCKYIEWALSKGHIAENPRFRPADNITKTEAMKLVLKVKNISKVQVTDNWQEDYMMTAYEYGIIENTYYDYNADATRGWIFQTTTATIQQEEEIKERIEKKEKLMSDEVM